MHDQNTDLHEIPIDGSFSQIFNIKYNSAAISKKSVYNMLGQRVGNHQTCNSKFYFKVKNLQFDFKSNFIHL